MKITVRQLKILIKEATTGGPRKRIAVKRKRVVKKSTNPNKLPPAALMTFLIKTLSQNGFVLKDKRQNMGSRKAWLDVREQGGAGFSRVANRIKKLLPIPVTITSNNYEATLRGKNFDINFMSPGESEEVGADVYVQVFTGKYAEEEKMGIDTGDFE